MSRLEDYKDIEPLRKAYLDRVESFTPNEIKEDKIFDLRKERFSFILNKEKIDRYNLKEWFVNYKKEALVSTAGIRGAQNVLYPWDTRYPLNELGVALATLGKALVLKENIEDIHKLCAGEVRYNTDRYIEIISRIQAAQGITTHLPKDKKKTTIWMTSFLIFMNDYDGGEYITSSHAISSKIATKDLDSEGSQFVPETSKLFVDKIEEILKKAEEDSYTIEFSSADDKKILEDFDGIELYTKYLRNGIATNASLRQIKDAMSNGFKILAECEGGSIYPVLRPIFENLEINDAIDWHNEEHDPFFHGIGKTMRNPITGKNEFFDYGCDTSLMDVVDTMGYDKILKDKPIGYCAMMLDPDGDRIVVGQIESLDAKEKIEKLGINFIHLDEKRLFTVYSPNQMFLMLMDYHSKQLKSTGLWEDHPRFIITTTPSAASWVEWSKENDIGVVSVPVGFKWLAEIMKRVERRITEDPDKEVIIKDIYGDDINLGIDPRLLFAGEESCGMITGPEDIILSKGGRKAIAMREKSDGEASIIVCSLAAKLFLEDTTFSENLSRVFDENNIVSRYDIRKDLRFYDETNPDPIAMKKEKSVGEIKRDKIDDFFLAIAISLREGNINLEQSKEILQDALPELDFSDLLYIKFVGDGTFLKFSEKFVELRKSGTDAIIKGYSGGKDKKECNKYSETIANYKGELTKKFVSKIPKEIYENVRSKSQEILRDFQSIS